MPHRAPRLALGALTLGALTAVPAATALAGGPPPAATAFATAVITPAGGSVSGFGITATFAAGAVTHDELAILGNWPNGQDVTPPSGQAVKTFGLQVCDDSSGTPTDCTSELGNYPASPSAGGTERVDGKTLTYTGVQSGVDFGTASDKLVTFTIDTGASAVYIYDPNLGTTAQAYPKLLPSTESGGSLVFQTFQPIVWTLTSPAR
ncbi:MAG TPA: hypothetical protein VKU92_02595 [Acidimicrobiales bacterium]|nr:hypothetical protein [Acidimicrobiales bacterium]